MNKFLIYVLIIMIAAITMAPGTRPPKTPPATQPVETEPVQTEPVQTQPVQTQPVVTEDITAVPERTSTPHREQKDKFANASLPRSGYGPQHPATAPVSALFFILAMTIVLAIAGALLAAAVSLWGRK